MNRRQYLTATAVAGLTATAGCQDILSSVTEPSAEEVKENAEQIEYETLYRNINDYEDEPVFWPAAKISDVVTGEGTKEYILTIPQSGTNNPKHLWGVWDGNPFQENDEVMLWGLVQGLESYTSMVGKQTVPKIKIKAMELR